MYYTSKELKKFGVKKIGKSVKISNLVKFYNFKGSISDNTRIDDYVILKGNINSSELVIMCLFRYKFNFEVTIRYNLSSDEVLSYCSLQLWDLYIES